MSETLPHFRYHPDPVKTGAVEKSANVCICCDRARGYIYVGLVYSAWGDYDRQICPWCIADGSAAEKLEADFSGFDSSEIPIETLREIIKRTPGYSCWQNEIWLLHCGDACEFYGDLPKGELKNVKPEAVVDLRSQLHLTEIEWPLFVDNYEPGGDPAIYKFKCLHCSEILFYPDGS